MIHTLLPYSKQTIDRADIDSVIRVLKSPYLTQGPTIELFEEKLKEKTSAKYVVAVNSATAALHAACFAIGIDEGDEIITSPLSFAASANCVVYCRGKPVFADIDKDGLIDPNEVKKKINKKTKAIVTVDYAGQPSRINELKILCKQHGIYLIQDAAHSLGATYYHKPIGSLSDITCFSFHPVKTITTGEGGAITTNDRSIYEKILKFRSHGIIKSKQYLYKKNEGPWYYEMQTLGYNYRLTDIQAALGISQLSKVEDFVKKRFSIARIYNTSFKDLEKKEKLILPKERSKTTSAWHLYPLRVNFSYIGKTKKDMFIYFHKQGINLQVHYIPIHLHPYYKKKLHTKIGDYPKTEMFYEQEISLPLYPTLKDKEAERVIKTVYNFINNS